MYLTGLQIEGFRGSEHSSTESVPIAANPQMVVLPGGVRGCAIADAITLFSASLLAAGEPGGHHEMLSAARRLGWEAPSTTLAGQGQDAELQGLNSSAVAAVIADGLRAVTVEAALALDPPLFGRMREHAARDPRMVTALGQDPIVRIKIGWLFSKDRTNATPSVLFLRVGEVGFELTGKDRPIWVPELLSDLGRRFVRTDPFETTERLAERWHAAVLSPNPAVRRGLAKAVDALGKEPFSLPPVGLLREASSAYGVEVVLGEELLRIRQLGRAAQDALRIAFAAFVHRPDVLVVDEPLPSPLVKWFAALTEADESPVEQVWHG